MGSQPDGLGLGSDTALVRAKRTRRDGNGRVYHIGYMADDGLGGRCRGEVVVGVLPKKTSNAVDDGAKFNSTISSFQ